MSLIDEAVLIQIPSGYKDGTLYSVLPNTADGDFDVARAGIKTRINSSLQLEEIAANVPALNYDTVGGCPHLNTEPAATNLLTYSNAFGNSAWTKSGATIEGDPSTAGVELVTDPTFSLTGTQAASTVGTYWETGTSWTIGSGIATCSHLTNSSLLQSLALTNNKVYKYSFDYTQTFTGTLTFSYYNGSSYVTITTLSDYNGSGTITGYFTTEADASKLRFLVSSNWGGSIDNVSVKEVSGYQSPSVDHPDAWKLVESDGVNENHFMSYSATIADANVYTYTMFIKQGTRDFIQFFGSTTFSNSDYVNYDLANKTLSEFGSSTGTIEDFGNGWMKLTMTATSTSAGIGRIIPALITSLTDVRLESYIGDGSFLYIYGAQLELGSVATSPIYTDGATATRLADVVTGAGSAALFSGVNSSGVLYAEIAALSDDLTWRLISISDGGNTNRIYMGYYPVTNNINYAVTTGGVIQASGNYPLTDITSTNKLAARWAVDNFGLWVNGEKVLTDNLGSITWGSPLTTISLNGAVGDPFYGNTKSIAVYNYLTDEQCEELTTL